MGVQYIVFVNNVPLFYQNGGYYANNYRTDTLFFLVLILYTAVGSTNTLKQNKKIHKCISDISGITILHRFLFSLHHPKSVVTFSMLTPPINNDTNDFKGLFFSLPIHFLL